MCACGGKEVAKIGVVALGSAVYLPYIAACACGGVGKV